ncbi:hypothetical protein V3C99_002569 [Haemonchus contortus]
MALDLGGNKKKPNDKSKYSIVELSLFKPGKKKYPEFDYEEIRKKQLKEDDSSGDDERFHDREALEIVKRLEAKYGGKKTKKGRKLCFGTEDDYMDKRAGYDLEDDFIDDSEAYDELIPSTMDTVQGGFYVNRGKLEFKTRHEEVNDSDISEVDDSQPQKKGTKRPQVSSDDDVEVIEDPAVAPTTSTNVAKAVTESDASAPDAVKPRMVGAPPSKVRRMTLGESPNQRAANAIKKRLVGMPPTLLKRKVLQTAVARKENEMSDFLRDMSGGSIPSPGEDLELIASTSTQPTVKNKTPEKTSTEPTSTPATSNVLFPEFVPQNTSEPSSSEPSASTVAVPSSPQKKRPLAPMTDTLSSMIEEFKRCTNNLALPGQKKRLQNIHVDMVIAIEEQCLKDGYSVHEKARVAHSLADYCGIQKNSLYARCIKRRDEHKNGAPNLAFLAKSAGGTFSNITAPTTAFNKTTPTPIATPSASKPTSSAAPAPTPSKSTPTPTTVPVVPSPLKSTSVQPAATTVPTTTSAPFAAKISTASTASAASTSGSAHTNGTSAANSTPKSSQPWTNQKKLAAQAMITNVAGLPSFSGRVGELQDILKKVATEAITYEDFLKWHDLSMKPASSKLPSENKGVNGVAKQGQSTSTSNKAVNQKTDSQHETSGITQSKNPPTSTLEPVKRMTLAQAMVTSKLPPRMRPLTLTSAQISEKFEAEKQITIRAVTTAIENSKVTHKKKCEVAAAAGKPPPRFDFLWTENLARALRSQMELYWSVLLSSDTYAKASEGIVTIFSKEVLPYFKGEIKLSRLLVEYTRRSPDKAFILACPNVQKLLKDDGVDLNNITIITRKEKTSSDAVASKTAAVQEDGDVSVVEPSTSNATTSNSDAAAAAATSSAAAASKHAIAALNGMGMNMTPTQMAELTSAMQQISSLTTDPQKLLMLQQALIMQVMTHNQVEAKRKQEEEKRKEEEKKKKLEEEKEAKRRAKEEEKLKLIEKKKAEARDAKEKALEEKRLRLEEEKKQKLAEKARKAEEEREKRLQEQAEKERIMKEERERLAREEAERLKKEEEERKRQEEIRIKAEEEQARESERKRQAQLREEEEKAAQLLEEEILLEEVTHSEVPIPTEMKLALEEEEEAESARLKKQEEQVAAVRAANLAAQAHQVHSTPSTAQVHHQPTSGSAQSTTSAVVHNPNVIIEQKPLSAPPPPKPQPSTPASYTSMTQQQSNVIRSPATTIPSSPQYPNPNSYGFPNSQGITGNITMSPQCMMPMTPPAHKSPAFHQQSVVQSPQQQAVASPLSSGQHHQMLNQRAQVPSALSCPQPVNHHSNISFDQPAQPFAQPQAHSTPPQSQFGFGVQHQQQSTHQQQPQPVHQQQYHQQSIQQQQQQQQQQRPMQYSQTSHVQQQAIQQHIPTAQQSPMQQINHGGLSHQPVPVQPQLQQQLHQQQQLQQQQQQQHQQMRMDVQQACGQYQSQIRQQSAAEQQQQLAMQQQRVRDMYMAQQQQQNLAFQRQQQQQQQQQLEQQQQMQQQRLQQQHSFSMQQPIQRTFPMQPQQSFQNDAHQLQMQQQQQQQMMNQYSNHQQNRNPFGF